MDVFVTHHGTATMLIEIGSLRLLTDPVFDPPGRTYSVLGLARYRRTTAPGDAPVSLQGCDAVLLSHDHHGDNLDESGRRLLHSARICLAPVAAAHRLGAPAVGVRPWDRQVLTGPRGERVRVTATPAQHGPRFLNPLTGPVIGFVLEWDGQAGGPLYISGDTVMFGGIGEVGRRFRVSTAILHVGRATLAATGSLHYTFTAEESARAAEVLGASRVFPIHYQGWSHFREGRPDVERAFAKAGLSDRLSFFPPGERFRLEG